MNRLKSACPTRPTALSTHIRASLLGLGSLAMVAFPMVSHADLTPPQQDLTKLYLASFLRAPDLGGLNYWNAQLTSGSTLQTVGGTIFSLPIVREIYPQAMTDKAFVEAIYGNVFQRESDLEGLNYWMKELASLRTYFDLTITDGLSAERARGQLVMNMINAGLGTVDGTAGKAYLVNRFNVAKSATEQQLNSGIEIPPDRLKTIGSCVTADASGTDNALDDIKSFYSPSYTLGGTVSGLSTGAGLSLKYGCGNIIQVPSNGAFQFPKAVANGVRYSVSVNTQPPGQECAVSNGAGTVSGGNVSNVFVTCASTSTPPTAYNYFGRPVPPAPGESTKIEGIDSDANGVRDEIDRAFAAYFENDTKYMQAIEGAKVLQSYLNNPLKEASDMDRSFTCKTLNLDNEERALVMEMLFNTEDRKRSISSRMPAYPTSVKLEFDQNGNLIDICDTQ